MSKNDRLTTVRRFAPVQPDLQWRIVAGAPHRLNIVSPRLLRPDVPFRIHTHVEDIWGNVTQDMENHSLHLTIRNGSTSVSTEQAALPARGWSNVNHDPVELHEPGQYDIVAELKDADGTILLSQTSPLTVDGALPIPRTLFGDLHVHSDDTVGTEDSTYNFTYGRDIAGLDVLGYTANDFQISQARWNATVDLIQELNSPGSFVIYPGTEWCGNSAAGGDHNVVFLADAPKEAIEFPFDRHGNVARSFEWSEDGPKDLVPGAWPLDEVYATYAADFENHLMIPHVGGRRCNLAWHHPRLERLIEIGSAWGQFEWQIQDAVQRGWKMGVCANSDEHRGRCGGGVPGTAVFGTRGGLTGILASSLDRQTVARALRARHTFATTGPRLVGLVTTADGHVQGDEVTVSSSSLSLTYHFLGAAGFASLEAFDASGRVFHRDLWRESPEPRRKIRVTWGGARLYDRYREAVWDGRISLSGGSTITTHQSFGGLTYNPEDTVTRTNDHDLHFASRTSGDIDGVHIPFSEGAELPASIAVQGTLGGYVKVGDPLKGHPHAAQPEFELQASWEEMCQSGGKRIEIAGGAGLFVAVEAVPDIALPKEVKGQVEVQGDKGAEKAVYLVGREWSGDKVVSSPVFLSFVQAIAQRSAYASLHADVSQSCWRKDRRRLQFLPR